MHASQYHAWLFETTPESQEPRLNQSNKQHGIPNSSTHATHMFSAPPPRLPGPGHLRHVPPHVLQQPGDRDGLGDGCCGPGRRAELCLGACRRGPAKGQTAMPSGPRRRSARAPCARQRAPPDEASTSRPRAHREVVARASPHRLGAEERPRSGRWGGGPREVEDAVRPRTCWASESHQGPPRGRRGGRPRATRGDAATEALDAAG